MNRWTPISVDSTEMLLKTIGIAALQQGSSTCPPSHKKLLKTRLQVFCWSMESLSTAKSLRWMGKSWLLLSLRPKRRQLKPLFASMQVHFLAFWYASPFYSCKIYDAVHFGTEKRNYIFIWYNGFWILEREFYADNPTFCLFMVSLVVN